MAAHVWTYYALKGGVSGGDLIAIDYTITPLRRIKRKWVGGKATIVKAWVSSTKKPYLITDDERAKFERAIEADHMHSDEDT